MHIPRATSWNLTRRTGRLVGAFTAIGLTSSFFHTATPVILAIPATLDPHATSRAKVTGSLITTVYAIGGTSFNGANMR